MGHVSAISPSATSTIFASDFLSFELELPGGIQADSIRAYIAEEKPNGDVRTHAKFAAKPSEGIPSYRVNRGLIAPGRYLFVFAFRNKEIVASMNVESRELLRMGSTIQLQRKQD